MLNHEFFLWRKVYSRPWLFTFSWVFSSNFMAISTVWLGHVSDRRRCHRGLTFIWSFLQEFVKKLWKIELPIFTPRLRGTHFLFSYFFKGTTNLEQQQIPLLLFAEVPPAPGCFYTQEKLLFRVIRNMNLFTIFYFLIFRMYQSTETCLQQFVNQTHHWVSVMSDCQEIQTQTMGCYVFRKDLV